MSKVSPSKSGNPYLDEFVSVLVREMQEQKFGNTQVIEYEKNKFIEQFANVVTALPGNLIEKDKEKMAKEAVNKMLEAKPKIFGFVYANRIGDADRAKIFHNIFNEAKGRLQIQELKEADKSNIRKHAEETFTKHGLRGKALNEAMYSFNSLSRQDTNFNNIKAINVENDIINLAKESQTFMSKLFSFFQSKPAIDVYPGTFETKLKTYQESKTTDQRNQTKQAPAVAEKKNTELIDKIATSAIENLSENYNLVGKHIRKNIENLAASAVRRTGETLAEQRSEDIVLAIQSVVESSIVEKTDGSIEMPRERFVANANSFKKNMEELGAGPSILREVNQTRVVGNSGMFQGAGGLDKEFFSPPEIKTSPSTSAKLSNSPASKKHDKLLGEKPAPLQAPPTLNKSNASQNQTQESSTRSASSAMLPKRFDKNSITPETLKNLERMEKNPQLPASPTPTGRKNTRGSGMGNAAGG